MGKISPPHPVKLLIGMLAPDIHLFDELKNLLQTMFGPVDLESPVWKWEHTDYYEKEMGTGLQRIFLFFEKLIEPDEIAAVKVATNTLEERFVDDSGGRRINLDPGYLDAAKLVLASTKDFSHRIYLGKGIYGEVTLFYSGDGYQNLPYTFPDYKTDEYLEVFEKARELFKNQGSHSNHK